MPSLLQESVAVVLPVHDILRHIDFSYKIIFLIKNSMLSVDKIIY